MNVGALVWWFPAIELPKFSTKRKIQTLLFAAFLVACGTIGEEVEVTETPDNGTTAAQIDAVASGKFKARIQSRLIASNATMYVFTSNDKVVEYKNHGNIIFPAIGRISSSYVAGSYADIGGAGVCTMFCQN